MLLIGVDAVVEVCVAGDVVGVGVCGCVVVGSSTACISCPLLSPLLVLVLLVVVLMMVSLLVVMLLLLVVHTFVCCVH